MTGLSQDGTKLKARVTLQNPEFAQPHFLLGSGDELEAQINIRLEKCDDDEEHPLNSSDAVDKIVQVMRDSDLAYDSFYKCLGRVEKFVSGTALGFGTQHRMMHLAAGTPDDRNPLHGVSAIPGGSTKLAMVRGKSPVLENVIHMNVRDDARNYLRFDAHAVTELRRVDANGKEVAEAEAEADGAVDEAAVTLTGVLESYKRTLLLVCDRDAAQREPYLSKFLRDNRDTLRAASEKLRTHIGRAPLLQQIVVIRAINRAYDRIRTLEAKLLSEPLLDSVIGSGS